jgi:HEAT repeat protein
MTDPKDLLERLKSGDAEERRRAVSLVAEEEMPRNNSWIVKTMGDSDWRVRKEATGVALRRAPDPELLDELLKALLPGDNVGMRNAAVEALGGFGQRGLDALTRALPTFDQDGRKLAIEAIAKIRNPAAVGLLLSLLNDEDDNVWAAAIDALGDLSIITPEVTAELERALRCGVAYKQLVVLEAINRMGVSVAFERLRSLVSDPLLRKAATIAVGRCTEPEAVEVIRIALEEASPALFLAGLCAGAEMALSGPQGFSRLSQRLALSQTAAQRIFDLANNGDGELDQQRNALLLSGVLATPEALRVIIRRLGDYRVGKSAQVALQLIGADATPALVKATREADLARRAICIELLGQLADDKIRKPAIDAIHSALTDGPDEVVSAGLEALARIGDDESMMFVMRWFDGKFPASIRLAAGAALAAGAKANPSRAKEIAADIDQDEASAAVVALFITVLDEPVFADRRADIRFLAAAAANPEPFVRRIALDALNGGCSAGTVEAIAFALNDEVEDVRLAAVRALGRARDTQKAPLGVEHLVCLVESTHDEALRAVALEALGTTGDARALSLLESYCMANSPLLAVAALEALSGFATDERRKVAILALEHRDSEVVKAALRVLGDVADSTLVPEIGRCLQHEAWDVRRLAADALGLIGSDTAKALLNQRLAKEAEAPVIDAIRRNLRGASGSDRPGRDELP